MWNNKGKILENIAYASKLYYEQQEKVKKEKYLEDLLFADYVEKIKQNQSRYDYCEQQLKEAQNELKQKGKKPHLRNFEKLLQEDFFNDLPIKIKDIIYGGYERYYWNINFDLNCKEYALQIPMVNNITTENVKYASYGQFVLYEVNGSSWETIVQSYKIEDISQYIKTLIGK